MGQLQRPQDARLSIDGVAITADQVTQRYHIAGQLTYSVVEQASQTVLTRGTLSNFTSYSTTGSTVSTRAAEIDAEERLVGWNARIGQLLSVSALLLRLGTGFDALLERLSPEFSFTEGVSRADLRAWAAGGSDRAVKLRHRESRCEMSKVCIV